MKKFYKNITGINWSRDINNPFKWEFRITLYDPPQELLSFFSKLIKRVQDHRSNLFKGSPGDPPSR